VRVLVMIFIYLILSSLGFYLAMWVRDKIVPQLESNLQIPSDSPWYSFKENLKNQFDLILYYYPFFIITIVVIMILAYIFSRQPESEYYGVRV